MRTPQCFNPRPPLPGGDAPGRPLPIVSTKFQSTPPVAGGRCRRAARTSCRRSRFQSTPPVAGGRCSVSLEIVGFPYLFQSTPPVAGGRCAARDSASPERCCFNPRPPLPGGDASLSYDQWHYVLVSIHAPRCRGAMLKGRADTTPMYAVSIHAPRCRGAMLCLFSSLPR